MKDIYHFLIKERGRAAAASTDAATAAAASGSLEKGNTERANDLLPGLRRRRGRGGVRRGRCCFGGRRQWSTPARPDKNKEEKE